VNGKTVRKTVMAHIYTEPHSVITTIRTSNSA
jgi:hypothetical protein